MERGDLNGAQAINKEDPCRWGSAFTDNEWLTLDYGCSVNISRVRINWENAHATTFQLQRSEDNTLWTTTKTVGNNNSFPAAFQQPSNSHHHALRLPAERCGTWPLYQPQAPIEPWPVRSPSRRAGSGGAVSFGRGRRCGLGRRRIGLVDVQVGRIR
jgi:F5/8 type C domain